MQLPPPRSVNTKQECLEHLKFWLRALDLDFTAGIAEVKEQREAGTKS